MEIKNMLIESLKEINFIIDEYKIDLLLEFMEMVLEENKKINLTSITDRKEFINKHIIDSIIMIKNIKNNGDIIKGMDMGTGAGFPGVPIKIINPDIHITLVDSLNKRLLFLEKVINKLNIDNIEIIHSRAEDLGKNMNFREKYDIVLSRAVANLPVLSEYCIPFVKVGGFFISSKGKKYKQEIDMSKNGIDILGGKLTNIDEINIPFTDITRNIIYIEKINKTPTKYPRKSGMPSKKPL